MEYLSIPAMLELIDTNNRQSCQKLYQENESLFKIVRGSTNNHQNWAGGYHDHIEEIMNIARALYQQLNSLRPLPFSLSDALLVLFLHDIEKPWKYTRDEEGVYHVKPELQDKKAQHTFRRNVIARYGIKLSKDHWNGMRYVEGENNAYSSRKRMMKPLAAFCHMADISSARIWFNHPLPQRDPWHGAQRTQDS